MSRAEFHLQANCVAIHEFGKDLEAQVGKLQYLAVLVFSAYASGLFMVVTNRPIGNEAFLPVGASGGTCFIPWTCILCSSAYFGLDRAAASGPSCAGFTLCLLRLVVLDKGAALKHGV